MPEEPRVMEITKDGVIFMITNKTDLSLLFEAFGPLGVAELVVSAQIANRYFRLAGQEAE